MLSQAKQSDDAHRAVSSFAWTMVLSRAIYLKVTARVVLMMAALTQLLKSRKLACEHYDQIIGSHMGVCMGTLGGYRVIGNSSRELSDEKYLCDFLKK